MHRMPRRSAVVALLALVASLVGVITPSTANATESIPDLQHSPITVGGQYNADIVTGPTGTVTIPCDGTDLRTYDASGQLIQQIPQTPQIDGVDNCIYSPVVDKNGDVYGIPSGGPNLLAYDGNTLKWKYPLQCGYSQSQYVVGADGNIYATMRLSTGDVRLIGLTPEVAPPLTQPAKVLDIDIPNDCSAMLYAYKDGIMVHGQSYGDGRFYSYSGTFLGQAPIGDVWYEKINADGQLFVMNYVPGGGFTSNSISMYDPLTNKVMWTAPASTSGADTNTVPKLAPLPGGGVAAIIREQRMVAGVPATPTEWVDTLVVINAAGQKIKSVQLPNEDPQNQNNYFSATYLNADATGNVIVTREMYLDTQISWPSTVPGISIATYNPVTDSWPYQEIMKGDVGHPTDPYGYRLEGVSRDGRIQPTNNTLNFLAKCSQNCPNNDYDYKVYSVEVNGLGVSYPRGVVIDGPPSVPYVALGDSYSSGEGVLPFENGTETVGTNMCHRSHNAYARLIGRSMDNAASLGMGGFHACSGAVTNNITTTGQHNEDPQVNHLHTNTKVVTLTIGGNDVEFEGFATGCFDPSSSCAINSTVYNTTLGKINNELPGKLSATYQAILNAAPDAQIYVLGYPQVAPVKTASDPIDARCAYLYDGGTNWADAQGARSIVTQLNAKIEQKVNDVRAMNAGNTRLHYIDPNASGSPFVGHTVCAEEVDSFFNNADQAFPPGQVRYVFHPNQRGQEAYAQLVAEALN